jgi:hypothetical protein
MANPLPERPEMFEPEDDGVALLALEALVVSPGWRLVMGEAYDKSEKTHHDWFLRGWLSEHGREAFNREMTEANAVFWILKTVRDRIAMLREKVGK